MVKDKGSLLDVGCGLGYFSGLAKSSGWEVSGTDISEAAVKQAKIRFGLNVFHGELNKVEFAEDGFDVVCFAGDNVSYDIVKCIFN